MSKSTKRTTESFAAGHLLFDERPLVISPTLAALIGLSESVLLQQIHYRCQPGGYPAYHADAVWAPGSPEEWRTKWLKWLSPRHARRLFERLVKAGYLRKESTPQHSHLWRIDYDVLGSLAGQNGRVSSGQNGRAGGQNGRAGGQNGRAGGQNGRQNRVSSNSELKRVKENPKENLREAEPETETDSGDQPERSPEFTAFVRKLRPRVSPGAAQLIESAYLRTESDGLLTFAGTLSPRYRIVVESLAACRFDPIDLAARRAFWEQGADRG